MNCNLSLFQTYTLPAQSVKPADQAISNGFDDMVKMRYVTEMHVEVNMLMMLMTFMMLLMMMMMIVMIIMVKVLIMIINIIVETR